MSEATGPGQDNASQDGSEQRKDISRPTDWPPYETLRFHAVMEGIELHQIGPDQSMASVIAAHLWLTVTGAATMEELGRYGPEAHVAASAILHLVAGTPEDLLPFVLQAVDSLGELPSRTTEQGVKKAEWAMFPVDVLICVHPRRLVVLELVANIFLAAGGDPRMAAMADVIEARLP